MSTATRARPPAGLAALGAACISSSAVLVTLAHDPPATVAALRCLLALPGLAALAWWEQRRHGRRPMRVRAAAFTGGLFLGVDLVLWNHSIADLGAGVGTVLPNLQVVLVALAAWALFGDRPSRRLAVGLPVVLLGVVLVSGVVGGSASGSHPVAGALYGIGTAATYAAYLLVLRTRAGSSHVAGPLAEATAGAAVTSLLLGLAAGGLTVHPGWAGLGWSALLALVSQTVGWLLLTAALPALPAALASVLLLLQPAAALLLAFLVLGERPSPVQLLGAALLCGGVVYSVRRTGAGSLA